MRRVISLWLPSLATDRLSPREVLLRGVPRPCRATPGARDRPLALVWPLRGRLVASAANRAAARAGVRRGMALADARAILPALATEDADPRADARLAERLADWCGRYTPWTAIAETDEGDDLPAADASLWLDVTGCAHLFGGEDALIGDLVARLGALGFTARAALADTAGAAWAVARAGLAPRAHWRIVPPGGAAAALGPLPVAALRLAPETRLGLEALGLRRIGDLLKLPRAPLAARFGAAVADRLDGALGRGAEPLSPRRAVPQAVARLVFAEPIGHAESVAAATAALARDLSARLEAAGRGARRLELALFRADGTAHRTTAGTSRPSRDAAHLVRLFADRLADIDPGFGFDAMTLAATGTEALGAAQDGFDRRAADGGSPREVLLRGAPGGAEAELIDRLSGRLGAANVLRFLPRESHLPERAVRPVPALEAEACASEAAWPGTASGARALRLLARPETVEAVAPVPDDPPVMFRWRRVLHRVARAEGPERIAPEWWRASADAAAETRDYYRVEDTQGGRFWLYREGLYRPDAAIRPAWFLHGFLA